MKSFAKRLTSWLLICLMSVLAFAPMPANAASTYTEKKVSCEKCNGTGKLACWKCKGSGKNGSSKCPVCSGSGRRIKCSTCDGKGYTITHVSTNSGSSTSAAPANTFVGTINGSKVTGYLDYTYQYRIDGVTEYEGQFVIYDSKGNAVHNLAVRVDNKKSIKTYTAADKKSGLVVMYYPTLSSNNKWGGCYTTATSKDWTFTLTKAEYSSKGVFTGSVNAVLNPGSYGSSKNLKGTVKVTGSFNMQMQKVHPTAAKYRSTHSAYNSANSQSFYQSYNDGVDSSSSSSSSSSNKPSSSSSSNSTTSNSSSSSTAKTYRCNICKDTKLCQRCHGQKKFLTGGKFWVDCGQCHGSGHCSCYYRW